MIEPQSAQDGASAWVANATLVPPPSDPPRLPAYCSSVFPLPFVAWPLAAPLVAMTVSSSFATDVAGAATAVAVAVGGSGAASTTGSGAGSTTGAGETAAGGVIATAPDAAAAIPPPKPDGTSSTIAERSISPSDVLSSVGRNREPSQRKM